jgi:flagellar hook-associated protein 3 FlgL
LARISERTRFQTTVDRIEKSKDQNVKALEKLSSQKQIANVSDNPVDFIGLVKKNSIISDFDSYQRNVVFSKGFIDVTEGAVSSIQESLGRAHELAIGMANDSFGPDSREATAKEIKEIMSQVVQIANTRYSSKYIFSGFRTSHPALSQDGAFLGDDGKIFLQIGRGHYKAINIPGRALFEANADESQLGHFNMIEALSLLHTGLVENDKSMIYKAVDELGFQMEKTSNFQATVGSLYGAMEKAENAIELAKEKEVEARSHLRDADLYEVTSDFKRTESILQSTLLASNKLLQPSLMNFLQ